MSYFKSFLLESNHEVLIMKNYDIENDCHIINMYVEDTNNIQTASISFDTEEKRNDAFNNYTIDNAKGFADFIL